VVLETDVVTGEPIPSKITPEGVYSLMWKQPNSVLVGDINPDTGEPAYRTKVKYWMQVTSSGVGFHDATWQTAFGGTLYQIPGTGSHGCINMPLDQAGALFNMIEPGTPVIFHW
jgi:lipoprotein-anchoring transpeptidase ErfK/SrfK